MSDPFRIPGLEVLKTGQMTIPYGPASARGTGKEGEIRGNEDTGLAEIFLKGVWGPMGGGSGLKLGTTVNANGNAETNVLVPVNTHNNTVKLVVPTTAKIGDFVEFFDNTDSWDKNPLTLTCTLGLNGSSSDFVVPVKGAHVRFHFLGATEGWVQTDFSVRGVVSGGSNVAEWKVINTSGPHTLALNTGYIIDSSAFTAAITLTLPRTNLTTDDVISIWDIGFNLSAHGLTIDPQGDIDGVQLSQNFFKNGLVKTLKARVETSGAGHWYTVEDNTSSPAGTWGAIQTTPVIQAGRNTSYMVDCRTASPNVFLPRNPRVGDSFWLNDIYGNAATHNIILHPGSGTRVMGQSTQRRYNTNKWCGLFVYTGDVNIGYTIITDHSGNKNDGTVLVTAAANHTLVFDDNVKTYRVPVTGPTTIAPPTFPANVVTSFFIILEIDATGGHAVTIPGTTATWFPGTGSQAINGDANSVNIIQGVHVGGRTFYNNSQYQIS